RFSCPRGLVPLIFGSCPASNRGCAPASLGRSSAQRKPGEVSEMFVQIIEGRVSGRDGLRRQMDNWEKELRPGAKGFLGSTAGVTDDGHAIAFARFDSAAAAKANSDRPEQGRWWNETEKTFDGPATFADSEDVQTFFGGGSDDAGFVQVMKGSADRNQM